MAVECAVAMCGNEGKIVPVCSNSHFMHLECLKGVLTHQESPTCPACRDPYLSEMKQLFQDTPFVYRPPSPGPPPNPLHFQDGAFIANQMIPSPLGYMPGRYMMRVETVHHHHHGRGRPFRGRQTPHYHGRIARSITPPDPHPPIRPRPEFFQQAASGI